MTHAADILLTKKAGDGEVTETTCTEYGMILNESVRIEITWWLGSTGQSGDRHSCKSSLQGGPLGWRQETRDIQKVPTVPTRIREAQCTYTVCGNNMVYVEHLLFFTCLELGRQKMPM